MKKLSLSQIESVNAGKGFIDGACTTVAVATSLGAHLFLTPIGGSVLLGAGIACGIYLGTK